MSRLTLELIAGPADDAEPISLAEAKLAMRVDGDTEDSFITDLIREARETVEEDTGLVALTQTWARYLDEFPGGYGIIKLPYCPVQEIVHIKYIDTAGDEQTLDASKYRLDEKHKPARIEPAYGQSWPSTRKIIKAVEIQWKAGYADAPADAGLKKLRRQFFRAMYLLMGHWYDNREAVGRVGQEVELAYGKLVRQLRVNATSW